MKNAYAVIAHKNDCGDETVVMVENERGKSWFRTIDEARKLMKEDYKLQSDDYGIEWTNSRKNERMVLKDEIIIDVPSVDKNGENGRIHCHWKIAKV